MEIKKLVRITDEQKRMLDFLIKRYGISENDIFRVALTQLFDKTYKEIK